MMNKSKNIIKDLYEDPVEGFVGISALQEKLKTNGYKFTTQEIKEALSDIDSYTLNKPRKVKINRRKYYVPDVDDQWQMDLSFIPYEKQNDGIKGVLTVIDLFSRYAWVKPIKTKSGVEISKLITDIFEEGRKPKILQVDKGSEFYNAHVKAVLKKYNVKIFSLNSETKSAFVESFNRTLKRRMTRLFDTTQSFRYIDKLPAIVKGYNSTKHSSIKMTPIKASKKENYIDAYANQYGDDDYTINKPKFKIGDFVRIPIEKGKFSKEGVGNYTIEIFKVVKVKQTTPITYELVDLLDEDILGSFYEDELVKVSKNASTNFRIDEIIKTTGKGKNKKHLVRWLGYSSRFDSWVNDKDIINLI